ncbi:hypothetical protein NXV13_30145 [Bacteroides ovatus]|nr:hypothetical protein [Bacteroides ovatus]
MELDHNDLKYAGEHLPVDKTPNGRRTSGQLMQCYQNPCCMQKDGMTLASQLKGDGNGL